jgi:hypothetical protein
MKFGTRELHSCSSFMGFIKIGAGKTYFSADHK